MAQIMYLKVEDEERQKFIGDVVAIVRDEYVLNENEEKHFALMPVANVSKEELAVMLNADKPETHKVYRSKTTEWTQEKPERMDAWKDGDDWKFINLMPKHQWNVAHVTEQQKLTLADKEGSTIEKQMILSGSNAIKLRTENDTIIPNLQVTAIER